MAKTLFILLAAFVAAASAYPQYNKPQGGYNNKKNSAETDEEKYGPPLPYEFAFSVNDDELTNYQNRQETSNGKTITGSYQVVDPDGFIRKVTYTADAENGFQAKVTREPTDIKIVFPEPKSEEQTNSYQQPKPQQVQYSRPAPPPPRYEPEPAAYTRYAAPAPAVETYAAPPQQKPRKNKKYSSREEGASVSSGNSGYRVVTPTSQQYVDFGGRRTAISQQDD